MQFIFSLLFMLSMHTSSQYLGATTVCILLARTLTTLVAVLCILASYSLVVVLYAYYENIITTLVRCILCAEYELVCILEYASMHMHNIMHKSKQYAYSRASMHISIILCIIRASTDSTTQVCILHACRVCILYVCTTCVLMHIIHTTSQYSLVWILTRVEYAYQRV